MHRFVRLCIAFRTTSLARAPQRPRGLLRSGLRMPSYGLRMTFLPGGGRGRGADNPGNGHAKTRVRQSFSKKKSGSPTSIVWFAVLVMAIILRHGLKVSLLMLSWVPVVVTFNQSVAYVTWVQGGSMKPALNPDSSVGWRDVLVLWKFAQRDPGRLSVGDVVVFRSPEEPEKVLIKRILGVGGDKVYSRENGSYPRRICSIPPNHLWVEGDNIHSVDSNKFGPVSVGLVVGKATSILFPLKRIGPIPAGGREARVGYHRR
jgi:inner membrane protease subunit 2